METVARILIAFALVILGCGAHAAVLIVANSGYEDNFAENGTFPVFIPYLIGQDDNTLALLEDRFAISTLRVTVGVDHAAIGQPLAVRLLDPNLAGTPDAPGIEVDFDRVMLNAAPVAGTSIYAVLGLGLLILACRRVSARI